MFEYELKQPIHFKDEEVIALEFNPLTFKTMDVYSAIKKEVFKVQMELHNMIKQSGDLDKIKEEVKEVSSAELTAEDKKARSLFYIEAGLDILKLLELLVNKELIKIIIPKMGGAIGVTFKDFPEDLNIKEAEEVVAAYLANFF